MKILTVLGTRPEIIRLSVVIKKLDSVCEHTLVHTGQNFTPTLRDLFFDELGVRAPDLDIGIRAESFGGQIACIIFGMEEVLRRVRPDRLLILGDTNSGLAAIVSKRLGIPVFHMEAGNRCYDDRVPEEINRRIIDHTSDVLMPYTHRSKENLLREGLPRERIFVTGNPIYEVLEHHRAAIWSSDVLRRLGLQSGKYFLVTLHRAENVDLEQRLRSFMDSLTAVSEEHAMPMVFSVHPRTRDKLHTFKLDVDPNRLRMLDPLGFADFVKLEQHARCVLSDSGTVQEECCIFRVPNVTLRDVTERPETLECGSGVLAGSSKERILEMVRLVMNTPPMWRPPAEYLEQHVSDTVVRILTGECR